MDTGFGNGHGLLLHDFVNSYTVNIRHLVKLINTDNTTVSKNHGTSLKTTLACLLV